MSILPKFSFIIIWLFLSSIVSAGDIETKERYEKVRSEYRELTINDPFLSDLTLWRELRGKLLELENSSEHGDLGANIIYLKSRISEQLGRKLQDGFLLKEAEQGFRKIVDSYSDSNLSDEALLALGRLASFNNDKDEELNYAKLVLEKYPNSDSAEFARKIVEESATSIVQEKKDQRISEVGDLLNKYPVVVIDPGHGGVEEGAKGPDGILEKDVVLKIALALRDLLQQDQNLRVELTRTADEAVSLSDRTKFANEKNADLFVSIHANASEYKTMRGLESYYLDNTNDKSSLKLAERENFTLVGESDSVGFIVSDFIQAVKLDDSITLTHLIHENLVKNLNRSFDGIKDLGVKKAPFFVLVGAHMPCALVEVSFIDHPVEGRRMADTRYQSIIAEGLYNGIKLYLKKKSRLKSETI